MAHPSPFFYPPPTSEQDSLAILHLKRDSLLPVKLRATADDGYAEGAVTNTRFGSFPHRTLIGLEWGSQVRASKVDTGSRGRKGKKVKQDETQSQAPREEDKLALANEPSSNKKRKSDDAQQENGAASPVKKRKPDGIDETHLPSAPAVPLEAGSGFIHILPPTPEAWTSSLDHRTQVVYTPDYSYILQRLRVRPGNTIIEAGAGSGSFTHAASRAIFNGYPDSTKASQKMGRVCSFEYHEPRVQTLRQEISDHGLDGIVELTHRDVCNDGFLLSDGTSPQTDAIFLDLPAPWTALKHLTRSEPNSPLNPHNPVHLCSFSPCIEQVIATVTALRKAGWADISMVEVQHKRIDVRRERVGLKEEGLRGVNAVAASVEESIDRLRQDVAQEKRVESKAARLEKIKREAGERKLYKEGRLIHRTEPEVKTHTSYLVFAVLPKQWSVDDEAEASALYSVDDTMRNSPASKEKETTS